MDPRKRVGSEKWKHLNLLGIRSEFGPNFTFPERVMQCHIRTLKYLTLTAFSRVSPPFSQLLQSLRKSCKGKLKLLGGMSGRNMAVMGKSRKYGRPGNNPIVAGVLLMHTKCQLLPKGWRLN